MSADQPTSPSSPTTDAEPHVAKPGHGATARPPMIGRALRISISLTLLTMSMLGVADTVGLLPNPVQTMIRERTALLELVAVSASQAINSGDDRAVAVLARDLLQGSSLARSVAIRKQDGSVVYESANHAARWASAPAQGSTLGHARLPVFQGSQRWGVIELGFDEPESTRVLGVTLSPQTRGLLLTSFSALLVYWICLHMALRRSQGSGPVPERIQNVFDAMTEAVVLLDGSERIVMANQAFWTLVDRTPDDLIGQTPSSLCWERETQDADSSLHPWRDTLNDGLTRTRQRLMLTQADGSTSILSAATAPIGGPRGERVGVLLTLDNVTMMEEQIAENAALLAQVARAGEELRQKNQELEFFATTDQLTGCVNRRALFETLHRLWSHASRHNEELGCIMADVDHFKLINDKHGHAAGDKVLQEVGRRLREVVRADDIVGRYGGEEFCIVSPKTDVDQAAALAERIRHAIEASPCGSLKITLSLGVSSRGPQTGDPESLIAHADYGLYAAKRSGRNRVVVGKPRTLARAA